MHIVEYNGVLSAKKRVWRVRLGVGREPGGGFEWLECRDSSCDETVRLSVADFGRGRGQIPDQIWLGNISTKKIWAVVEN